MYELLNYIVYLTLWRHSRRNIVRIQCPAGNPMDQFDFVTVPYFINRIHHQIILFGSLNNPPVVHVLEAVAGHLLLMARTAFVRISHGIHVRVRMQPTGATQCVTQCDLRALAHDQRLALGD